MGKRRPLSVTLIGWLFIAAGVVGLVYHATKPGTAEGFQYELAGILLLRALAIVGGVYLLRARNWARWLLLAWLAFHVVLSAFHPLSGLLIHILLLAVIAYLLLRPEASAYFRRSSPY